MENICNEGKEVCLVSIGVGRKPGFLEVVSCDSCGVRDSNCEAYVRSLWCFVRIHVTDGWVVALRVGFMVSCISSG